MIGRLNGIIVEKKAPAILLDVSGVGYELQVPMTTFYQLPEATQPIVLHTHFSVSENAQQLFGFIRDSDRQLFRLLIKVSGVGPKMALGILSMESADFVRCVACGDVTALTRVPGVGKKTAERLIVEMKDKLDDWDSASGESKPSESREQNVSSADLGVNVRDAESALVALGYKPAEASKAIKSARGSNTATTEELIRVALKSMLP